MQEIHHRGSGVGKLEISELAFHGNVNKPYCLFEIGRVFGVILFFYPAIR